MLKKSFDDDWKWWLWTYVKQTKNKEDLFTILLNAEFDWELISKELNFIPLRKMNNIRKERQKRFDLDGDQIYVRALYKTLADNPRVHRVETHKAEIYEVEDFLGSADCEKIIEIMTADLTASTITNPDQNLSYVRTSSTSHLRKDSSTFVKQLNETIHKFMNIPVELGEEVQAQRYDVGQQFQDHTDWFDETLEFNKPHLNMGQRTWTLMVYLNNVEEGGETDFPEVGYTFKPKKGKAVIWNNLYENKQGNPFTKHAGRPVKKGVKNIITKWFREKTAEAVREVPNLMPESP
jgi:prolyl 4-hydroxylase